MGRLTVFAIYSLCPFTAQLSSAGDWVPLWPDGAPGADNSAAESSADQDVPALMAFPVRPDTEGPGAATIAQTGVIICPGGGYGNLAMDHEGRQIAAWLNERGIHAWILRYRLAAHGYHHPVQRSDVLRAVRTVRADAAAARVDPQRIGIWGFSAGGHLASTAATHFDAGNPRAADAVDRVSSRPDFAILAYPVITMTDPFTHKGSRHNLLGAEQVDNKELIALLSNETQVTKKTPPTFIFHTTEDPVVPVENALAFYAALRKHGVPCEMHIYQKGRHGVGLGGDNPVLATWPRRLEDWLRMSSF